jgi:hypothetical protein
MDSLVQLLQLVSGVLWLLPLVLHTPSLWRVIRGKADLLDMIRAPHWFVALVMVLGSIRWLVYPGSLASMSATELVYWAAIYLINIGAAAGVAIGSRGAERLR